MSQPLPISVIILTYNEEANLPGCLRSVAGWAGEIVIVDSGSTDRTVEIARRYTDQVAQHPFENYARQRNWAQDNLSLAYEWVFHIDADERVTPELEHSLRVFFGGGQEAVHGVLISRRTVFLGRAILHGGHYPVFHLRLFRHSMGRCEDRLYDQHFLVDGPTCRIQGDLIDVLTADLTVWMTRHVRWAALEAQEHFAAADDERQQVVAQFSGTPIQRRRWLRSSLYGRAPLFARVFGYYFYRYILRLGFLDGVEGLIFHFLQGCWYRFYIDCKIYEMRQHMRDATASPKHAVIEPQIVSHK